jgi:hypothetical protein
MLFRLFPGLSLEDMKHCTPYRRAFTQPSLRALYDTVVTVTIIAVLGELFEIQHVTTSPNNERISGPCLVAYSTLPWNGSLFLRNP